MGKNFVMLFRSHASLVTSAFVLLSILVVSTQGQQSIPELELEEDMYYVSWSLTNSTITINLVLKTWAWCGIGWHKVGSDSINMLDADIAVALFDPDTNEFLEVTDRWSPSSGGEPPEDTQTNPKGFDNIHNYFGSQYIDEDGNQITQVSFTRLLVTNDTNDDNPIVNANMTLIWAYGNDQYSYDSNANNFGYHGGHAGSVIFNLFTFNSNSTVVVGKDYTAMKYWHGTLMTFAFAFCMSIGIFLPRYMKSFWGFPIAYLHPNHWSDIINHWSSVMPNLLCRPGCSFHNCSQLVRNYHTHISIYNSFPWSLCSFPLESR